MAWSITGIVVTLAVLGLAWWRMRAPAGYYDGDVYAMTRQAHNRYFAIELGLLLAFVVTLVTRADRIAVWVLAVAVFVDVLYVTSFLRGASGDE
jgi:hypothetical protein